MNSTAQDAQKRQDLVRTKRAEFALKHPNAYATPLDCGLTTTTSMTHTKHRDSQDSSSEDSSSQDSSTDTSSLTSSSEDEESLIKKSHQSVPKAKHHRPREDLSKAPSKVRTSQTKAKRNCADALKLNINYDNIYISGSKHGRKRVGAPDGIPGSCSLMWSIGIFMTMQTSIGIRTHEHLWRMEYWLWHLRSGIFDTT